MTDIQIEQPKKRGNKGMTEAQKQARLENLKKGRELRKKYLEDQQYGGEEEYDSEVDSSSSEESIKIDFVKRSKKQKAQPRERTPPRKHRTDRHDATLERLIRLEAIMAELTKNTKRMNRRTARSSKNIIVVPESKPQQTAGRQENPVLDQLKRKILLDL